MKGKLKLRDVLNMLRDREGWHQVHGRVFDDEITYRDTGFYIYADCGAVTVRRFVDPCTEFLHLNNNVRVVYQANPFAYILTSIYTAILWRYLRRVKSMKPCAASGTEK